MSDTRDDAPPTTGKHDPAREAGGEAAAGTSPAAWAVTINRPVAEVYATFRDFANLPLFMDNVEAIEILDDTRSRWTVAAPGGGAVQWTARVTEDVPERLIAWESEADADVPNRGTVAFRDAGARGTVLTATIFYQPPGGVVGKLIAKLFQREPAVQTRRDLRRFKQWMETGEVATAAQTRAQLADERT